MSQKRNSEKILDVALQISLAVYLFFIPVENHSAAILYCSLTFSVIILLVKLRINRRFIIEHTELALPLSLFFLWSLSSVIWSILPGVTFKFVRRELLVYLILFYLVRHSLDSEAKLKKMVTVCFSSALFIHAYGIFSFFMGYAIFNGRLIATFSHPNVFGLYAAATISFAMSFVVSPGEGFKVKILPFLVLITGVSALVFSSSRANMLGLVIAFLIMSVIKERRLLLILVFLLLFMIILSPFQRPDLTVFRISQLPNLFKIDRGPLGERYYMWYAAFHIIKDNPIAGIGYGKVFGDEYIKRIPPGAIEDQQSHSHNVILEVALETGIVGLFLFLWLHLSLLKYLFFAMKIKESGLSKRFLVGYALFFLTFSMNGLVDFISRNRLGLLFWFLTSIMVGIASKKMKKS